MNKISFGVRVPNSGPLSSIENIVNATKSAEDMGFDAVWVHDHVVWSSEMHRHHISSGAAEALSDTQDANFYEATTILSYLAAETKKIVLGVACLVMPCRNPIYAAKQYSTLDILAKDVYWSASAWVLKRLASRMSSAFSACPTNGAAIVPMNISKQ